MNILFKNIKKKLFFPGGPLNTAWDVTKYMSLDNQNSTYKTPNTLYDQNQYAKYGRNADFTVNDNARYGMNSDYTFNENTKIGGVSNAVSNTGTGVTDLVGGDKKGFDLGNAMDKASAWGKVAEVGVQGAMNGAKNTDQGKHDTTMGVLRQNESDANNVNQAYTAGQELRLMGRNPSTNTANSLKTHKGWKNILSSTASGAMAGAAAGGGANPYTAIAGAAIGLIGSSLGEIFGRRKRKKMAEQEAEQKRASDYAVDYYNSKQAEQLASANDNTAHSIANQNRYSVFGLMARGGKRNCLTNKNRL